MEKKVNFFEEGSLLEKVNWGKISNNGQIWVSYIRGRKGKLADRTNMLLKELRNRGLLKIRDTFTPDDSNDPALINFTVFEIAVLPHNIKAVKESVCKRGRDFCVFCSERGTLLIETDPESG